MEPITFSESELQTLYASLSESGKLLLEVKYGKELFSDKQWKELFLSFCKKNDFTITHDASIARTQSGSVYLPHADPQNSEEEHDNASRMIRTIIATHNKEKKWIANYSDKNQYRYFPIFEMKPTGLVFSLADCELWNSRSFAYIGAPFVTPTSEDAEKISREYLPIYKKLLINQ